MQIGGPGRTWFYGLRQSRNGSGARFEMTTGGRAGVLARQTRGAVKRGLQRTLALVLHTAGRERSTRFIRRRALTASSLVPPAPVDIVGNYVRGLILEGTPESSLFETSWVNDSTRGVVTAETVRIPSRLRAVQRRLGYETRFDEDFAEIIWSCRRNEGSWLTPQVIGLYEKLHALGFVPTVGTYSDGKLIGGLWGLQVGRTFGIMSVFHHADHAGTIAQVAVLDQIGPEGRWDVVDCGTLKKHYARFGFHEIPAEAFCELVLRGAAPRPT